MSFAYKGNSDIDTHLAVEAFRIMRDKGDYKNGEFHFGGLMGSTDFDGYTVFLHDDSVDLTVFYKHRYKLDYDTQEHLMSFRNKIRALADNDATVH